MAWHESWHSKLRRRFRKPFNKLFHRKRYFVSRYYGADFLLRPDGIGTLEMSAKIAEYPELTHFMRRCADLHPESFIDIGANIGLYSCVLLRNGSVPRAILFEPDRLNLVHLKANLMINGLLDRTELHELALGDAAGRLRLCRARSMAAFRGSLRAPRRPGRATTWRWLAWTTCFHCPAAASPSKSTSNNSNATFWP